MSEALTPEVLPDGRAKAPYLIPLWTLLAVVTLAIAVGAVAATLVASGSQLAGFWGVPLLALAAIGLFGLTLQWMDRRYTESKTVPGGWERLPAPSFWLLPIGDGVTRTLRTGAWVLLLALAPIALGYLAYTHFQTPIYQQCALASDAGCALMPVGPTPAPGAADDRTRLPFRVYATGSASERLGDHLSARHLWAHNYWKRGFQIGGPAAQSYFPGPQAWLYLALIAAVGWLWLRILLSILFGRMILASPGSTLRRLARLRIRSTLPTGTTPHPELPRPMLRVGIIGHRDLVGDQRDVAGRLAQVLARCELPGYGLRIVSGMAAGTDRLAVQWALDQLSGAPEQPGRTDLELLVVLPAVSQNFRNHGIVNDQREFDQQLARVQALQSTQRVALLELPGVMGRHSDPRLADRSLNKQTWDALKAQEEADDAPHRSLRIAAHRYKTDVLLRQCEFLVAVMKLSDAGKPGGTRECVEAALALNTPVLVIDIDSDRMALVTRVDQLSTSGLPVGDGLDAFVRQIKNNDQLRVDATGLPTQLSYLHSVYRAEEIPPTNRLAVWWSYFEAWFFNERGPKSSVERLKEDAEKAANANKAPAARKTEPPFFLASLRRRIADDQNAIMTGYRGAFVLAYVLGLVAISLALTIVLMLVLMPISCLLLFAVFGLTCLKLRVVYGISTIIHLTSAHQSKHRASVSAGATAQAAASDPPAPTVADIAVALRYVAERLRIMPTMVKLGGTRMDLLHQSHRMGEPARVAEDLCRRIPLDQVIQHFDHGKQAHSALDELITLQKSQLNYNTKSNTKWQRAHDRLEAIVAGASKWVIRVIWADVVVVILKLAHECHWIPSFPGDGALKPIGLMLVVTTALLPALMATCNALIFQTQSEQLAEREHELAQTFDKHLMQSALLKSQIQAGQVGAPVAAAVLVEAERSAAVLAEEVAEWAVMSKQKAKDV